MRVLKAVLKTLAWIIGILLLLLLLVAIAIQIPAVQNKVLAWATPTIEEMLGGANVEIDHIDLDFFDAAHVEGILIEDLRGDTLVYAKRLGADIGALRVFGGAELFLDEVSLDGAVINAYQLREDTAFNYQFVLDAFAPADTAVVDTAAAMAFGFGLRTVDITNTRIRLLDEQAPSDLNFRADRLLVNIESLNLDSLAVAIADASLEGVTGSFVIDQVDPIKEELAALAVDTSASGATEIVFPYAGMPVQLSELSLKRINFTYQDRNLTPVAEGLDAGNIDIQNLQASAANLDWDSTHLTLDWQELSFRERSGLSLEQLAFGLSLTPRALDVNGLELRTDASQVLAKADLNYTDFSALVAMAPSTQVNLVLDNSYLAYSDIRLLAPTLEEAGLNLGINETLYANGAVSGTLAKLRFDNLDVRVGRQTAIAVSGTLSNPLDPDAIAYDLRVNRLTSSYSDLNRLTKGLELPKELATFGRFSFSGAISGTTTTFQGSDLRLSTDGRTSFQGDIALRNLDDPDNLYIDARGAHLRTNADEIAAFVPDSVGVDVAALGDIDFDGSFTGTLTKFDVDGALRTDLGSARADLVADLNADYTDGTYKGQIALDSFNVGRLLQDTTLGTLTFDVSVDGSGLTPEALVSNIDGKISSFTYLGYTYHDIIIKGDLDRQLFNGFFSIDDPNAKITFDGMVNVRDSVPDMAFVARIDTLSLKPLNLYPTPLGMSMAITANMRGNSADNLFGRMQIDSFYLQDSSNVAFLDSLLLRAGDTSAGRFLVVTSELIDASIIGDYSTADLPILLTNYINDFFPIDEYLNPVDAPADMAIEPGPQRVIADQSFDYYFGLQDPIAFANIFDPALKRLDTLSFSGRFDTKAKELTGQLYIPDLNYDGTRLDTILLDIGGDASGMLLDLRTRGIAVTGQEIDMTLASLTLRDDSLQFDVQAYLERDSLLLGTGLSVHQNEAGRYVARMDRDLKVAGQTWKVNRNNYIEYWNNYLYVEDLVFSKDGQEIALRSDDRSTDTDIAPITATISNYQLSEVARLVQLDGFSLTGLVNGKFGIRDPGGELYYIASLDVEDIVLNKQPVGTLVVNATSEGLDNVVGIDVRLDGPINDLSIGGEYEIASGGLDLDARIRAFELRVIDPLAVGVLSDSEGLLRADLDISGTVDAPKVEGFMALDNAATTFELLGSRLAVADSRIELTESRIDFGTFVLADSVGREATLTGVIDHDYFTEFDLDLHLATEAFRILNLEPSLDLLYYGKAVVGADIDITGPLEMPVVRGNAATKAGTDVSIVPLLSVNGISEESWVIYADPEELARDTTRTLEDVYNANALGIDLALEIAVRDEAVMHVIIDPATGDALQARGDADLVVQMTPDGAISVTGLYTMVDGAYQFTLATGGLNVKKFEFDIKQGSTMRFVGDPLDSRFDITAMYTAQTTTYELIESRTTLTPAEESAAKRRQPVNVLMSMSGTLEAPDIDLDIEVPESRGSGVTNQVQAVINSLSEQEIYSQVFSLLLFNSFQGGGGGGGFDPGAQGKAIAISSISNLISNQLNSLADNVLKGFDVNIGIESYEDKYTDNQNTTANLDVSKSLFNDRLTVTVGTDVNVSNQSQLAATNTSAVQSNFVLTYKLTESGRYLVRVFRRPDYDIISSATPYENGAGVSYRRRYD